MLLAGAALAWSLLSACLIAIAVTYISLQIDSVEFAAFFVGLTFAAALAAILLLRSISIRCPPLSWLAASVYVVAAAIPTAYLYLHAPAYPLVVGAAVFQTINWRGRNLEAQP
jgi:hypothetical protein